MKQSTKRLLVIIGGFFLAIGSIYVYFSLIVPTYQDIQTLRAERISRQQLLANQSVAETAVNKLIGEFQGLSAFQEAVSILLPRKDDIPAIVNQMQGMARLAGITLESLSFQYIPLPQQKDPIVQPVGTVRASMSLFGTYEALKSFVALLETNVRVMDLSSLKVDGGGLPNRNTFLHNVVVDIYYQG